MGKAGKNCFPVNKVSPNIVQMERERAAMLESDTARSQVPSAPTKICGANLVLLKVMGALLQQKQAQWDLRALST